MYAYLDALWDRLCDRRSDTLLQRARRRFLTFTAALTVLIASVWVSLTASSVFEGRPLIAFFCALVPAAFAPFPYLALRTNLSLDALSHGYLITLYIAVTLTVVSLGGAVSTTSFFLMLLPLLSTLLFGIRVGLIWTAIITATYVALDVGREALPPSAYEMLGSAPNDWIRAQEVSLWNAIMMVLLSLAGALSVANFREIVGKSSALLAQATHETEDARAAKVEAEDVARSKAAFMANVSHELRTPLNAVIGYSELLIESAEERGASEDASDNRKVLDAALRLRGMVNDILKLTAIDAGAVKIEVDECRASELAADAIDAVSPALRSKGSEVFVEDFTLPGFWIGDGEKIATCVRHLLANAAHCSRDGKIYLRLRQTSQDDMKRLVIEVEDDGPSVAPERVELLFEPFAQPEASGARHYEGMALNLAITRRLARLLGGDLLVASNGDTLRTTFRLEIPCQFIASAEPRAA